MMRFIISFFAAILMFSLFGCEQVQQTQSSDLYSKTFEKTCLFTSEKIKFNQLTEFTTSWQILAYIDVFDQFDSRMKAAGVWRFELYEYTPRSSDPMGTRLYLWPDIELTDAAKNQSFWQDFLHCYKFELSLDINLTGDKTYILQAVCFTADGKRITDTIELKSK
ncbi:MAG: hypothetical protein WC496_03510 [Phycisphaerae bacterium]